MFKDMQASLTARFNRDCNIVGFRFFRLNYFPSTGFKNCPV